MEMRKFGMFNQGQQAMPDNNQFNINQFRSFLPNINNQMMEQLINQARNQGISENDINAGLVIMRQLLQR